MDECALPTPTVPHADALRDARLAGLIQRMAADGGADAEAALGEFYEATLGKVYGLSLRGTPHGLMRSRKATLLYLRGADPRDCRPQA